MKRRTFMTQMTLATAAMAVGCNDVTAEKAKAPVAAPAAKGPRKPNIIFILADDLGYAELGCYGQTKIKTPNIDRLCKAGMKFSDAYSGHAVCAPSRCTFLTGLHTGHSHVRDNLGTAYAGQLDLPLDTVTVAKLLKQAGYATACCGKWGLGGMGTGGVPWKQGFDEFYGYLDQWRAHSYYPEYLYRNDKRIPLRNKAAGTSAAGLSGHGRLNKPLATEKEYFDRYAGPDYCTTGMIDTALQFIHKNKTDPFFLYYATPIPHVAIQVPEEDYKEYKGKLGDKEHYLGERGYLPHPQPRAGYAAMVSHMDRNVGKIMDIVTELGLDENTLIIYDHEVANWYFQDFWSLWTATDVTELPTSSTVSVFPNPSTGQVWVSGVDHGVLSVLDIGGRQLASQRITASQTEMDLSNFPAGVYILKIAQPNQQVRVTRVIKQ